MGIIYALSPIIIVILSSIFFQEKLKLLQLLGISISFFGVSFVIFKGELKNFINLIFTYGDLWIFVAAIGWAVFSINLINWKSQFSIFARFALMSLIGSIIIFPFYLIEEVYFIQTNFDQKFIFFVLMASIFPGVVAFTMYTKLQQLIGASLAGLTVYLMPIYASIYGMILFGEELQIFHFYGALLVLLGIFLANKKYSK